MKLIILKKIRDIGLDQFLYFQQCVDTLANLKNSYVYFLPEGKIDRIEDSIPAIFDFFGIKT